MLFFSLSAEVKEIDRIHEIANDVNQDTILLLDIDETLIESPIMLDGKAWRKYVSALLTKKYGDEKGPEIHDRITYFLGKNVPYIPVEASAPALIQDFQNNQVAVFGFTARGKDFWYDLPAPDGQEMGILHLEQGGFNFDVPYESVDQALLTHVSFGQGVFFAYPIEDKGTLTLEVFSLASRLPSRVVFVDDKLTNVQAVDKALQQLGIASVCYYYTLANQRPFDPMVAYIQMEKLFCEGVILSDNEALGIKAEYDHQNSDQLFLDLVERLFLH